MGEALDRRALRQALLDAAPWLAETDWGPQAVDAGSCDRCGSAPRLLPTCGPSGAQAVCRACGDALGDDGWCDGHLADGRAARRWARSLPDRWEDAVLLWWVATGELRYDPGRVDLDAWGAPVRVALRGPH